MSTAADVPTTPFDSVLTGKAPRDHAACRRVTSFLPDGERAGVANLPEYSNKCKEIIFSLRYNYCREDGLHGLVQKHEQSR